MIENFKELYKRTDNPLLRDKTLETLLRFKGEYVTFATLVMQHSKNKKYKANEEDYNGEENYIQYYLKPGKMEFWN